MAFSLGSNASVVTAFRDGLEAIKMNGRSVTTDKTVTTRYFNLDVTGLNVLLYEPVDLRPEITSDLHQILCKYYSI
jgi:hypothetical protein